MTFPAASLRLAKSLVKTIPQPKGEERQFGLSVFLSYLIEQREVELTQEMLYEVLNAFNSNFTAAWDALLSELNLDGLSSFEALLVVAKAICIFTEFYELPGAWDYCDAQFQRHLNSKPMS